MGTEDDDFEALFARALAVMPEEAREDLRQMAVIVEPWLRASIEQAMIRPTLLDRLLKERKRDQADRA